MTVNGLIVCGKSLAWGPQRLHSSAEGVFVDEGIKANQEDHATRQTQGVRGAPYPSGRGETVQGPGRDGTSAGQHSKMTKLLGFKRCLHC